MDLFVALIHFPSQAERPHVGPHFFNISQAFGLGTGLARSRPAKREYPFGRPDRVLLFMIYNDSVCCRDFPVVTIHIASFIDLIDGLTPSANHPSVACACSRQARSLAAKTST